MISRRFSSAFVLFSLAGVLAPAAVRADPASTSTEALIGGTLIHRVRTSWSGYNAEQRADKIQQRINMALAQGPIHPDDITVGQLQGDWCVLFRGRRLLTADPMTAHEDHSTPHLLATDWARHLQSVLPELTKPKGK